MEKKRCKKIFPLLILIMIMITISSCQQDSKELTAFTNINLIPMTVEQVIPNQTVLVSGSEIIEIGDTDDIHIPQGTQIIDGNGAYLLPGLADMHMHTRADWEDSDIWPVHPLYLYLANGVTTVRDFGPDGSPITYAQTWQDEIQAGTRIGPTIYTSGIMLYASPIDDPAGIVQQNYESDFDFLKFYSYLSLDDFSQAMTEAKALGMYTTGHIPYAVGLDGVLDNGMDEIAHVEELLYEFIDFDRNQELTPEEWASYIAESAILQFDLSSENYWEDFQNENQIQLEEIGENLRANNVPVCTTMVIDDVIQLKLFYPEIFLTRPENIYFEDGYKDSYYRGDEKHLVQCRNAEAICALKYDIDLWILESLQKSDVILLLGTDSGTGGMGIIPGYSIHDELDILVENGFTPYKALKTGTVNAAIVIEEMIGEGNFGTIEIGNRADFILVADNPLADISALRTPLGVMAYGRWYSAETLAALIKANP